MEGQQADEWVAALSKVDQLFGDNDRLCGTIRGKLLSKPLEDRLAYFSGNNDRVQAALEVLADAPPEGETGLIRAVVDAIDKQFTKREKKPPRSFSAVKSTEALNVLADLDLVEVDGNELEPVSVPEDVPEAANFDYSVYPYEDMGTPDLLKHHQTQLELYGVRFGRNGFKTYDIHTRKSQYTFFASSGQEYRGTGDGCVAPYGLTIDSAGRQCRILYEHEQSDKQKVEFLDKHPDLPRPKSESEAPGPVEYSQHKGQAIMALVGAYAYNAFSLVFDLTDGEKHNLLKVRDGEVVVWTDLTASQAYYVQAQLLNKEGASNRNLTMESLPEIELRPHKKLRGLRGTSPVLEQLDTVLPHLPESERLDCTRQIIASWLQASPSLEPEFLHMFT